MTTGANAPDAEARGWMERLAARFGAVDALMNVGGGILFGIYVLWLTAFLYMRAGPSAFAVWVSVGAVIAPLSVLDAGLTLAVTRSTAASAAGRDGNVQELATAVSLYAGLGAFAVAAALLLTAVPVLTLSLSGEAATTAVAVGLFLGLDLAVGLVTTPWLSGLRGMRRFHGVFIGSAVQVMAGIPLTLVLFDPFGLPGAAVAQVVARIAGRAASGIVLRRAAPWFPMRPRVPQEGPVRRVLSFSGPLIVIAVAGQVSFASDVLVVGAFAGSLAASAFAIGAKLPALASSFVQQALDVFFPSFVSGAAAGDTAKRGIADWVLRLAGLMGCAIFLFLILTRDQVLELWVGPVDPLASQVLLIYALAWCIHAPAHVIALMLVASGRHRQLAPIIGLESIVNLALSITLVLAVGPIGAAVGSLVAVGVSNLALVPWLGRRQLSLPTSASVRCLGWGGILGVAIAVTASTLPAIVVEPGRVLFVLQCSLGAVLGGAAVVRLWPKPDRGGPRGHVGPPSTRGA